MRRVGHVVCDLEVMKEKIVNLIFEVSDEKKIINYLRLCCLQQKLFPQTARHCQTNPKSHKIDKQRFVSPEQHN